MQWGFFIDANLEPRTAEFLRKEGYSAEYSDCVLDEDADDTDDILPYVRQEELMIVTRTSRTSHHWPTPGTKGSYW